MSTSVCVGCTLLQASGLCGNGHEQGVTSCPFKAGNVIPMPKQPKSGEEKSCPHQKAA